MTYTVLRIEDKNGYGFETSFSEKRKKFFHPDIRYGFLKPTSLEFEYAKTHVSCKLTQIEHIQFYIGITQYLDLLPLYSIHKEIIYEDEYQNLKKIKFLKESEFIKRIEELGFKIYEYTVDQIEWRGFGEVSFHVKSIFNKKEYIPKDEFTLEEYVPKEVKNLKKNRNLTKLDFVQ